MDAPSDAGLRYSTWPYYLLPYGWSLDAPPPGAYDPTPPDWTLARPPDRRAYTALLEELAALPTPSLPPRPLPSRSPAPSPHTFFARVPPGGRTDPRFVAYRMAQRQRPSDPSTALLHPALVHAPASPPDLIWDLTQPLDFPALARTALRPLCAEEFLTPATHPPRARAPVRLAVLPGLGFSVRARVLGDVLHEVLEGVRGALSGAEWNAMRVGERAAVIRGWEGRTGERSRVGSMQLLDEEDGETEFVVGDALEGRVMFAGFEVGEPGGVWYLHTTTREGCRRR